jgi:hypothetical protein
MHSETPHLEHAMFTALTGFALNGTAPSRSCCGITRCVLQTAEGTGSERAVSSYFRRALSVNGGFLAS